MNNTMQLFQEVINANENEKMDLFLAASNQLGVPLQHIEKDFWVCLILDLLFNVREPNAPRLLFKGGTSLSKAYSLITRFSEDIDITIFREDLCDNISLSEMHSMSKKQQKKYIDKVMLVSAEHIKDTLKPMLEQKLRLLYEFQASQVPVVTFDPNDSSMQTLLIQYSSVDVTGNNYVMPFVKIECGARSALDPHQITKIQPYIANVMDSHFVIDNVVTIHAERTFWDKIVILHGLRKSFDKQNKLRQDGHRLSRHYYDVFQLLNSSISEQALLDHPLGMDCVKHASIFFNSASLDLASAKTGAYSLVPSSEMASQLKNDYNAMRAMIFGEVPQFDEILDGIFELEKRLNLV